MTMTNSNGNPTTMRGDLVALVDQLEREKDEHEAQAAAIEGTLDELRKRLGVTARKQRRRRKKQPSLLDVAAAPGVEGSTM